MVLICVGFRVYMEAYKFRRRPCLGPQSFRVWTKQPPGTKRRARPSQEHRVAGLVPCIPHLSMRHPALGPVRKQENGQVHTAWGLNLVNPAAQPSFICARLQRDKLAHPSRFLSLGPIVRTVCVALKICFELSVIVIAPIKWTSALHESVPYLKTSPACFYDWC